jgi:hypothetical protein
MFYIGVDLGQRADFTAFAVVEREEAPRPWMVPLYRGLNVRWLERLPLGTPYTAVARRAEEIAGKLYPRCEMAIDATGLGAPVVDLLKNGTMRELAPVVITGGGKSHSSGGRFYVPKRDLVAGLQLLLEKEELRIASKLREARALARELIDMRMNGTQETHDDLVLAVALASWQADRPTIGYGGGRLPGI